MVYIWLHNSVLLCMKKKRKINEILIMIYFRIVHIQNKKTRKGKIENSKFQKKKITLNLINL
jgi:hypothetical protein